MNKSSINKLTRKFGFEVHGNGFLQSLRKPSFKEDAFLKQKELIHGAVKTIFDVGANVGEVALKYRSLFPNASIYAFEPFPDTYQKLTNNCGAYNHITTEQLALSDSELVKPFYVNHNADTNSLLQPALMGLSADTQVANKSVMPVATTSLDYYCKKNQISSIDILKLDIQGGELAALHGSSELLAGGKINLIYTEAYFRKQYVDQPLFHDIAAFLSQHNYFLQDLYNPIYGKGSIAWCDAIFIPK